MILFDAARTSAGATIRVTGAICPELRPPPIVPGPVRRGGTQVLALVLSAFALLAAPALAAAPGGDRVEDRFALTISGGVSLGAYEAGLNWALVRFMRLRELEFKADDPRAFLRSRGPELVAVTGASAGSINALLAAPLWCEAGDAPRN